MPNGLPYWNWLPSPRRLAGVAALGGRLAYRHGLPAAPAARFGNRGARDRQANDRRSDVERRIRFIKPPRDRPASGHNACRVGSRIGHSRCFRRREAHGTGSHGERPTVATPLLDAAVARVDGGSSAPSAPAEPPPSGRGRTADRHRGTGRPASPAADTPSEPLIPAATTATPAVPPQVPPELASAPAKSRRSRETGKTHSARRLSASHRTQRAGSLKTRRNPRRKSQPRPPNPSPRRSPLLPTNRSSRSRRSRATSGAIR